MTKRSVALLFAFALAAASVPASAGRQDPMVVPVYERVESTNGIAPTAKRVSAAIIYAGRLRGWTVVDSKPGQVTLRYAPREHEVVVAVDYDAEGFKISYVSSKEMDYEIKRGVAEIHRNYNRWIRNLAHDIHQSPVFHLPDMTEAETAPAPAAAPTS